MKSIITSLFALLCLTMVSCSDSNDILGTQQSRFSGTRTYAGDAYVRVGMYANLNGYCVRVKNMRVEDCLSVSNVSAFGTAITNADMLPNKLENAIFDNSDGKYNTITLCNETSWIVVHFDLEVSSDAHFETKMDFKDVKYYISPEKSNWTSGEYYDYVISIDKELLGLSEITFGAEVEDFQDENNADVDC